MVPRGDQVLKGYLESLSVGKLNDCLRFLANDVVISEPESLPYGGEWVGHDGFLALVERMSSDFEPAILESETHSNGTVFVVRITAQFTARSTGNTARVRVVELYHIDGGVISRVEVYYQDPKKVTDLLT